MRKITRKGWVRKLDKLLGVIVKERDGKCIVCGTTQNLTPGHLFSRIAYSTRWDLDNVYAQCLNCNFRHESDPYPMFEAVQENIGGKVFNGNLITNTEIFIEDLHRKYVTPHKFKDFQLEELYHQLEGYLCGLYELSK